MAQKVRVLIIDDHPLFRQGIRWSLEEASDMEVACAPGDRQRQQTPLSQRDSEAASATRSRRACDTVEAARNAEAVTASQRHHVSTCDTLTIYPNRRHWPVAGRGYSKAGTNEAPTGKRLTRNRKHDDPDPAPARHSPDRRIHRRGKMKYQTITFDAASDVGAYRKMLASLNHIDRRLREE